MSALAPLLRPASWRLSPGAADVPLLRCLGAALLLASTLALLAWCIAVWLDAWRMRAPSWVAVLALPLCAWGLWHAWQLTRAWLASGQPLTLRWTGPIDAHRADAQLGGWRVDEWGANPIDVSLVWDWQRYMLLRLQPIGAKSPGAWVWLQDRPEQIERQVHRLRTLLCLPANLTRPVAMASAQAGLMASSAHEAPAAAPARMNRNRRPSRSQPSARHVSAGASSDPLRLQDDFPATQVLERWSGDVPDALGNEGERS